VARHALKNYQPSEIPTDHIPTRAAAARAKFADVLEFVEASTA
jgi:acyl-CoA dehydrogenase